VFMIGQDITNIDIHVLMKVNEIARRFGLRASDVESTLTYDEDRGDVVVKFPYTPAGPGKAGKFGEFLDLLGATRGDGAELRCEDSWALEETLDAALLKAPAARSR